MHPPQGEQRSEQPSVWRDVLLTPTVLLFLVTALATPVLAQTKSPRKKSIIDTILLDPAIRRAGLDPASPDAEAAKRLGKDWLNPFASDATIRSDMQAITALATGREEQLQSIYSDSSLSPEEKRARIITILGNVRECPACHATYPLDVAFCPKDGTRLTYARTMQGGAVALPSLALPLTFTCNIQSSLFGNHRMEQGGYQLIRATRVVTWTTSSYVCQGTCQASIPLDYGPNHIVGIPIKISSSTWESNAQYEISGYVHASSGSGTITDSQLSGNTQYRVLQNGNVLWGTNLQFTCSR